ncbi:hypothetical protein EV189_0618 [Motilibacter rhizosphaerae]|uniref:Uncharacterized protein n=1 Tax=Motilibacter rhizosphaerae TaxID=598652 RepID=A0A4Q7NVZ9_9ACTN|nr:hypothetical protein [Motilibacter rhizosphaerae]RZS91377.1 hypothetical protein EV189_0618 [Motilibacter rhizosphaerae]
MTGSAAEPPLHHDVLRPEDGEVLGRVVRAAEGWQPQTVFGAALGGPAATAAEAEAHVREHGLTALAEPWEVRGEDGTWQRCWLLEVRPQRVRISWTPPKYLLAGQTTWLEAPGEVLRRAQ